MHFTTVSDMCLSELFLYAQVAQRAQSETVAQNVPDATPDLKIFHAIWEGISHFNLSKKLY